MLLLILNSKSIKSAACVFSAFLLLFLFSCAASNKASLIKSKEVHNKEGSWPTYLSDIYRSGNGVASLSLPLKHYWSYRINKRSYLKPSSSKLHSYPVVVNGRTYIGSTDNLLYALNIEEKNKIWKFETAGGIESSPSIYQDKVVFGTTKGRVYAINNADGSKVWSVQLRSPVFSSPLIVDGKVVIKSVSGDVNALNISTGKKLWHYREGLKGRFYVREHSSPAYFNKKVYICFADGSLVALNINDGSRVFRLQIDRADNAVFDTCQPVISNGMLYLTDSNGTLIILDEIGEEVRRFDTIKASTFSITKNKIFLFNKKGQIFAVNKITGETLWRKKLALGTPVGASVSGRFLIVSSNYETNLFDIKFLGTKGGYIEIFDINTGESLWGSKVDAPVSSTPVVTGKDVLFLTKKGVLHIFR